ncbi:hypothetical protein [Comamonas testosteroni]|uniref:hypothetical protein n=1 Tax=Comamonas testosteroni TaxID=285 RepID=UPI0006808B6E|nr:hypothetical protein [Comamonas testosteroni]
MRDYANKSESNDYLGYTGLVVGVIGTAVTVIFAIKDTADWKDYSLIGSGWTAAIMFALFMWRANRIGEKNHKNIGELNGEIKVLNEKIKNLENELVRCNAVSHYLATLDKPISATPRVVTEVTHE